MSSLPNSRLPDWVASVAARVASRPLVAAAVAVGVVWLAGEDRL